MGHLNEPVVTLGLTARVLVATEETQRIVPIVENLEHLDALVAEPVQFLFVDLPPDPRLRTRILAQVVTTLPRQVVGDEVLAHTRVNRIGTTRDVLQPPAMVFRGIVPKQRSSSHVICIARNVSTADAKGAAPLATPPATTAWVPDLRIRRRSIIQPPLCLQSDLLSTAPRK